MAVTTQACSCGGLQLSLLMPWVAYVDTCHTIDRCGPYVAVALLQRGDGRNGRLGVMWPEETQRTRPADSWRTPTPPATVDEGVFRAYVAEVWRTEGVTP